MADFRTKQNDTKPIWTHLQDVNGNVDLTNASSVVFNMRDLDEAVKVSRGACTVVTATTGYVKYPFQATDTDTNGFFKGEFEVTWSDGVIETYPENGYIDIEITDDIA